MAYLTTWEHKGILVCYSAQSSVEEIAALIAAFQADSRCDDVRYVVHDFRNCSGLALSQSAIEELAATDAAAALSKRAHRVAVVSDRADVQAMVQAYMAAGFHPEDKLRLFPAIEAARCWACA